MKVTGFYLEHKEVWIKSVRCEMK